MWIVAEYEFVSLFSLKPCFATSSGGKTLLVPTPYALKMALLEVTCRLFGVAEAKQKWPEIRDLDVAVELPEQAVVTNLFQKILKARKEQPKPGVVDYGPFQRTIAYREYVHFAGSIKIGLQWHSLSEPEWLLDVLLNLSYLGKRGGFVQLIETPQIVASLPVEFVGLTRPPGQFSLDGVLQVLDDCSKKLSFEQVSSYTRDKVTLGKDRILHHIEIPYQEVGSSRSYTHYKRLA